jgi:hypothetical protein
MRLSTSNSGGHLPTNILRISALLALATTVACGGSSSNPENTGGVAGTTFPPGSQGGNGGWAPTSIDGGTPVAAQTCFDRAAALVELLTPAQCYGQMTQVDSPGLTVNEATAALLGSVLSGGSSDPASGNKITDWISLVTSYVDIAKTWTREPR